MSKLPHAFEERMKSALKDESEAFFTALDSPSPISIRKNPFRYSNKPEFNGMNAVPWTRDGYYLPQRPSFTFDPFFHAGYYYVQEASSMFLEEIFRQHIPKDQSLNVVDLCAAPGGKSTHLLSLLSENSLLISNEVIGSRAGILSENITRWGKSNVIVSNNDPEHFTAFKECMDLVLVDAPCSGEGMFRKDPDAINEWSEGNVQLCASRQRRILDQAYDLVKPGGFLIYSTCTFAEDEDENNLINLAEENSFDSLRIELKDEWGIKESIVQHNGKNIFGYRFYPHKVKGEGFFISILKKENAIPTGRWPRASKKISFPDRKMLEVIKPFIHEGSELSYIIHHDHILAFPASCAERMHGVLNTSLHIRLFGIEVGEIMHNDLVPSHAFALSNFISTEIQSIELSLEEAIMYLQKKDLKIQSDTKGWHLMKYEGATLGWAKILPTRMNNSYPKEWRIRKEIE